MADPTPDAQLSSEDLARLADEWNEHPGLQHMGVRLDLSTPGRVRAVVDPIQPHHRGGLGTDAVNGPVIAGVFDLVIGLTGFLYLRGRRAGVAQLNVHFLRPVEGDRFVVFGRPLRVGRNLVFCTAELEDEWGVVCARSDGIVAVAAGAGAEATA